MTVQIVANMMLLIQTENVKRNLYAIASVERNASAGEGRYLSVDELIAKQYLGAAPVASLAVPADGRCFIAAVPGLKGGYYYSTSESGRARHVAAGPDTSWCAPFPVVAVGQ